MGKEMLPLIERFNRESHIYSSRSIQIDPLIFELEQLLIDHPDSFLLAAPIREAIDEAMEAIEQDDAIRASRGIQIPGLVTRFAAVKHISRTLQRCSVLTNEAMELVSEGNSIVRRWDRQIQNHYDGPGEGAP